MANLRTTLSSMLVALCAASVLAACGNDAGADETASEPTSQAPSSSSEDASTESESTTTETGLPACADVWVDGQDLPKDYTACDTDGETVKPVKRSCGYGAKFLEQDGRFYAMAGHQVTDAGDLETNDEYQQLLATCQA